MSGGGPDIFALDVLSYYKYADSGAFADLLPFMEADDDFDINDYRRAIFEGTRYKSGQYMIPLDFGFWFTAFNKDRVDGATIDALRESRLTYWEMTDLIRDQFAADDSDARVINFIDGPTRAFRTVFNGDYGKYVDLENKTAHFTDGDFVRMLDGIERQRRDGYFAPTLTDMTDINRDFSDYWDRYYLKYEIAYMLQLMFRPGRDAEQEFMLYPDEIAGLLVNSDGNVSYQCYQSYAMNANSRNKELAWAFLKFLLSEEMQLSLNLVGLPVHNAAFAEKTKTFFSDSLTNDGRREITEPESIDAYNAYMERLEGFVSSLRHYPVTDWFISNMVAKEVALVFNGTKTAEEVAATLQNRVQLYLDE
jgi:multiple sugar transport system substrate-binding protein